jgi:hypothetical protein
MLPIPVNMMFRSVSKLPSNFSPPSPLSTIQLESYMPRKFTANEISDLERILPKSPVRRSSSESDTALPDIDLESMLGPSSPIRSLMSTKMAFSVRSCEDPKGFTCAEMDVILSNASANMSERPKMDKSNDTA